jgi:hypothetical protein
MAGGGARRRLRPWESGASLHTAANCPRTQVFRKRDSFALVPGRLWTPGSHCRRQMDVVQACRRRLQVASQPGAATPRPELDPG